MICPCKEADAFRHLKRILYREIRWYKENKSNQDLLYDESIFEFHGLSRGECEEILRILSEDG